MPSEYPKQGVVTKVSQHNFNEQTKILIQNYKLFFGKYRLMIKSRFKIQGIPLIMQHYVIHIYILCFR